MFKKINRNHYPKIVQKWSFSAYIGTFVFAIGNKLYSYFIVSLATSLISFLISFFNFTGPFFTFLYFICSVIGLLIILYLILYGRILAWESLGYRNTEADILKFKNRQKKILFWAWAYYIVLMSLALFLGFNYPNWYFLNN